MVSSGGTTSGPALTDGSPLRATASASAGLMADAAATDRRDEAGAVPIALASAEIDAPAKEMCIEVCTYDVV